MPGTGVFLPRTGHFPQTSAHHSRPGTTVLDKNCQQALSTSPPAGTMIAPNEAGLHNPKGFAEGFHSCMDSLDSLEGLPSSTTAYPVRHRSTGIRCCSVTGTSSESVPSGRAAGSSGPKQEGCASPKALGTEQQRESGPSTWAQPPPPPHTPAASMAAAVPAAAPAGAKMFAARQVRSSNGSSVAGSSDSISNCQVSPNHPGAGQHCNTAPADRTITAGKTSTTAARSASIAIPQRPNSNRPAARSSAAATGPEHIKGQSPPDALMLAAGCSPLNRDTIAKVHKFSSTTGPNPAAMSDSPAPSSNRMMQMALQWAQDEQQRPAGLHHSNSASLLGSSPLVGSLGSRLAAKTGGSSSASLLGSSPLFGSLGSCLAAKTGASSANSVTINQLPALLENTHLQPPASAAAAIPAVSQGLDGVLASWDGTRGIASSDLSSLSNVTRLSASDDAMLNCSAAQANVPAGYFDLSSSIYSTDMSDASTSSLSNCVVTSTAAPNQPASSGLVGFALNSLSMPLGGFGFDAAVSTAAMQQTGQLSTNSCTSQSFFGTQSAGPAAIAADVLQQSACMRLAASKLEQLATIQDMQRALQQELLQLLPFTGDL